MKFLIIFLSLLQSIVCLSEENRPRAIVIRHGESRHNMLNIYNSNPSHPMYLPSFLTQKGKEQIRKIAKQLLSMGYNNQNIEHVHVAPLERTTQTAELLAKMGLYSFKKIILEPLLIEVQMGDLENQPKLEPWHSSYCELFNVETDEHVASRVAAFYQKLIELKPSGNILVVTHGQLAENFIELVSKIRCTFKVGEAKIIPLFPTSSQDLEDDFFVSLEAVE